MEEAYTPPIGEEVPRAPRSGGEALAGARSICGEEEEPVHPPAGANDGEAGPSKA